MFALVALICFILALFISPAFSLVTLGFVFVALHLLFGSWPVAMPWHRP